MLSRAGKWLVTASIGLFLSVPLVANATVYSLGTLSSGSTSPLFGSTSSSGSIGDTYYFTLGGTNSVSAFAASFEFPSVFGLTSLTMDLYQVVGASFAPRTSGTSFGPTPVPGGFINGSSISPFPLSIGNYALMIGGSTTGVGGSYAGTLQVAAVPEPEVWAMMLIGIGLIGYQLRRKLKSGPAKNYGMLTENRTTGDVLGCRIDALTWDGALSCIFHWAKARQSRYVCQCNVHGVVAAIAKTGLRKAILGADMATPDGMPVALALALQGFRGQPRISGPELMWNCCERAAESGVSIFLYGSTSKDLPVLIQVLKASFPNLKIADAYAPPFRQLSDEEDADVVCRINDSGAGLVFVGLGCPKQELWMANHKGRIHAVMLGVGAAFDFHSGKVKRAPDWMQDLGLEWLSRLLQEPGRLWRRYLVTNSIFLIYLLWRTPGWILSRRGGSMTETLPAGQESRI